MLSPTRVKQLKARLKAEKTPLLYSVVYRYRDAEYHEDTLCVETDKDAAKRFAKRWAKKKEVFLNDYPQMWMYEWKKHKVISQWPILVKWKKEH
ncbi:hypothetical protein UFOVP448_27 [uncultured Caudovirales phage]|uniref:Uncharacterized protein n=1 Tax=uncultured Caudovirales phage TaxID=2100421 RepID=A0A6J5MBH9_9CAUD|nr:hypothetical protein UFOVP448_27 [uncultured Caudovirales phage]